MLELSLSQQIPIFINEIIKKRVFVCVSSAIISVAVLIVGVYWPKVYESRASVLWNSSNAVSPLLKGGVGNTSAVRELANIAREIIFSNKILDLLIAKTGLGTDSDGNKLSERDLQALKVKLFDSVQVSNKRSRLISVSYRNSDSMLSYLVVSTLTELFIEETRTEKNRSSQEAFEFIDRQVGDYRKKLDIINENIIKFKRENVDIDSDTSRGVSGRVNSIKLIIRQTSLELSEARVQKSSLKSQLRSEREAINRQLAEKSLQESSIERTSIYTERLKSLQVSLDTLRLSYTDDYPDIIQTKEQIRNLQSQIQNEESQYAELEKEVATVGMPAVRFVESELFIQISSSISTLETNIKTLEARLSGAENRLEQELLRSSSVNQQESQLEEMARDLNVTQTIYDDLLTRRENARVSLNMQLENQGASFKLQEPATIPLLPSGLRFLHFMLICIPIGLAFPLSVIFVLLMIDGRIRHEDSIALDSLSIPVIGVVGEYYDIREMRNERKRNLISIAIVTLSIFLLGGISILKYYQVIGV